MALNVTTGTTVYEGLKVSYGVAPLLNTLTLLSRETSRPNWDIYLVNVETLIRNHMRDTSLPAKTISQEVLNDMQVLSQYIAAYNRNNNSIWRKKTKALFFYLPYYEYIPKKYLRDRFPKGTEARWTVRDILVSSLKEQPMTDNIDGTKIFYVTVGSEKLHTWPHRDLWKDVCSTIENAQFSSVLMISHVPLDFHLYKRCKSFTVLESYTGVLKTKDKFGKKVFGDELFPFNKYTHLLLGDKWYVRSMVTPKVRNRIKECAKRNHWAMLPDKNVLADLVNLHVIDFHVVTDPEI